MINKDSIKGFEMKVKVLNLKTNKIRTSQEVSDGIFARNYNESLVHQITTAYIRLQVVSGTKAQKNRAAVRGGR